MSNRTRDGRKFGDAGRAVVAVLQEHKITGYTFEKVGKHPSVTFELNGVEVRYHFPGTPGSPSTVARRVREKLTKALREAGFVDGPETPQNPGAGGRSSPRR